MAADDLLAGDPTPLPACGPSCLLCQGLDATDVEGWRRVVHALDARNAQLVDRLLQIHLDGDDPRVLRARIAELEQTVVRLNAKAMRAS